MPYVDVELYNFDDDDLVDELRSRGYYVDESRKMIDELFQVLKSFQCDTDETFKKNMRIFYDRWYSKLS